jgi:hypothetical protein
MRAAPAVPCAKWVTKNAHEHTGQRRRSDIPCAMALRLIRALPGDRAFLSPSPRENCRVRPVGLAQPPQDLTPASRRQDHTTSPYAPAPLVSTSCDRSRSLSRPAIPSRARCRRVHRNPIPTFGDDGQRPSLGDRMARVVKVICPTAKAKICPSGCFVAGSILPSVRNPPLPPVEA